MQASYDYLKVVLNTTQNGPEVGTLRLIVVFNGSDSWFDNFASRRSA